jgi:hypothetical protein
MNQESEELDEMPVEIDFSAGTRGLHHIPAGEKTYLPVSIERGVWEYFSGKAEQKGVALSDLLSDLLKRDMEVSDALR